MEGGGSERKKKMSFGFSSSHEKIKLIDILSEDDDFLVASPFFDSHQESTRDIGFRLSGFGDNTGEIETIQQKEKNLLPSRIVQPIRPSFLRRSLAWDSAFFDGPGVLDHDELFFINKGFAQDIRKRRPELGSVPNTDNDSLDWFEIEPSIDKLKPNKPLNVQSHKDVDRSSAIKTRSNQASSGKSINAQKKESTARRKQGLISSPRPPLCRTTHISSKSNNRDLSRTTTGSGQALTAKKKPALQSSWNVNSSTFSSPTFSSISASSAQAFSSWSTRTEPTKSKLSSSLSTSTSKIQRLAERSKRIGNVDDKLRSSNGSVIGFDKNKRSRTPSLHDDAKETSDLRTSLFNLQTTSSTCSAASLSSAENFRPSGLRPPSPQMRFFDENTPPRYQGLPRNPKRHQKVHSEGTSIRSNTRLNSELLLPDSNIINSRCASSCKKIKSSYSEVGKNVKRPKTNHNEPENPIKNRENGKSCSENQVGSLSRYLEGIDLNQENATEAKERERKQETQLLDSPNIAQKLRTPATATAATSMSRTPLADKNYWR